MPFESRNIALIGTGNVASRLGHAFKRSGNRLVMLLGRNKEKVERLAFELGCPHSIDLHSIPEETDVVIIAVKDDAIAEVADKLLCPGKIVAHTSGSVPMTALGDCSDRVGVFYPLQTLHRDMDIDMRQVPFCIEANTNWNEGVLMELARTISTNVQLIDSEQRKVVHLAAVLACNFSNHCYAMAEQVLGKANVSLDILKPLIQQTAANILKASPSALQTGPAIRGDDEVMRQQAEMLQLLAPDLSEIYELMSRHIQSHHHLNRK